MLIPVVAVLAACGSAAKGGASTGAAPMTSGSLATTPASVGATGAGSLHVTYSPHGQGQARRRHWTLHCGPAGGTHPRARAACAELAAHPLLLVAPAHPCRLLLKRGAPAALVVGRYRGRSIDRLVRPGCGLAFSELRVLLTGG